MGFSIEASQRIGSLRLIISLASEERPLFNRDPHVHECIKSDNRHVVGDRRRHRKRRAEQLDEDGHIVGMKKYLA